MKFFKVCIYILVGFVTLASIALACILVGTAIRVYLLN